MGWRDRLRKRMKKAVGEKKVELTEKVEKKVEAELHKKSTDGAVSKEKEIADKAMARLRMFVPKVPPIPPTEEGKPAMEIYNSDDAYRDIQRVLHYLMNKEDK